MALRFALASVALLASTVHAQSTGGSGSKCGPGSLCPSSTPCCSQYGECGVGAYCLGGCDPLFSNSLDSCVPEPVCQDATYDLSSLDGITDQTKYLGDASQSDWVSSGTPLKAPSGDAVILTLSQDGASGSGTLLASTHYVWYGKVSAQLKTSRGQGIVSAFILLSDNKDEIDFEFIGTDLHTAQSNFYWQGVTNYNQEKNLTINGSDTYSDYHTYEVDWNPTSITWSIDGNPMRTLNKKDTFNTTDNQYHYPQTPARVQLSLWPAGLSKNGQGTVDWSGGLINWNSQDVQNNGYFYAMYKNVSIDCYSAPSDAKNVSGKTSYVYGDNKGLESSIAVTDDPTVLKSLLGTGTDMDKDLPHPSGTQSSSAAATSQVNTIPGLTGGGPGTDGSRGGNDDSNGSGGGGGGGSAASGTASGSGSAPTSFSQGDGGSKKGSAAAKGEEVTMGSMFAAFMAFVGMLLMM